ncbi:MAG: YciI family protein [Bifidobacteriaceae bacterium]|jgi:uncharacterized protein YciI|nr:YciI family protein [Bifidobacteriaceae bacterium]
MAIFAVHYRYADNQEAVAAAKPAHRAYLAERLDEGTLLASGPFADALEGLLIIRVDGLQDAEALVAADPIVRAGLVDQAAIRPWSPTLGPFTEG